MTNLCWLKRVGDLERKWVGEKAFLLSQVLHCNLPVFPGFVISSQVLQKFLTNVEISSSLISNLAPFTDYLNSNNYQALQELAITSRRLILNSSLPIDLQADIFAAAKRLGSSQLIIRSSLIDHQISGQDFQDHRSNILINSQICPTNSRAIALAIKLVWAELFAVKNLFYWHQLDIDFSQRQLAILIQPINNAIASGTVTINSQTAYIEATWGLGYSLKQGEVDPDRYRINLSSEQNTIKSIGSKRRGYHLVEKPSLANTTIGLEAYSPTKENQQRSVLSQQQLETLTTLIKKVTNSQASIAYLEWILATEVDQDQNYGGFVITQLNSQAPNLQEAWLTQENQQNIILKGIPASPGIVTQQVFVFQSLTDSIDSLKKNIILATKSVEPQHINLLPNLAGIITEQGGATSHSAIIARELGIPAVVAAKNATSLLKTGSLITLDGTQGIVSNPDIVADSQQADNSQNNKPKQIPVQETQQLPASPIPLATKLLITISQFSSIEQAKKLPIKGVGLLRSEFMLMKMLSVRSLDDWLQPQHQPVLLDYLIEVIGKFGQEFSPKPIYYRSLDFPLGKTNQDNPHQSHRGTYAYLQNSAFFELELTALAKIMEQTPSNIKLILPFVRSLREWQFCQNLVRQSGLTKYPNFQLWIMLEVPSLIFMLPEYIDAGVQGVAIGMNDLTHLLLGINREHTALNKQNLTGNSLAIERAITQIIQITKENRIPCSICLSDQGGNLEFLDKLVRWGINMISVEPQSVVNIHNQIMQAERKLIEDF